MTRNANIKQIGIQKFSGECLQVYDDHVCSEEPLEIRVTFLAANGAIEYRTLAITMRTPGNDIELARGFLYSEGVITDVNEITASRYSDERGEAGSRNSLELELKTPLPYDSLHLERRFTTYSSCGLCGKTSIQSLELQNPPRLNEDKDLVDAQSIKQFSAIMFKQQTLFQQTGSAHGAGLFDKSGKLIELCEDIGRHNALDKLIGHCLTENPQQLKISIVLVSGRASFELVQKAIMAGIPVLAAVGAPSTLAVETAKRFNLTLIGFLRSSGFNVYNAGWRLKTTRD